MREHPARCHRWLVSRGWSHQGFVFEESSLGFEVDDDDDESDEDCCWFALSSCSSFSRCSFVNPPVSVSEGVPDELELPGFGVVELPDPVFCCRFSASWICLLRAWETAVL